MTDISSKNCAASSSGGFLYADDINIANLKNIIL
jgi:hypothetical protein